MPEPDNHEEIDAALAKIYIITAVVCLAVGFALGWAFT